MNRIIIPTLAFSLLGLSACIGGGGSADAAKLIPDEAEFIGGADVKAIMASKVYTDMKSKLEEEKDFKEAMDSAKACNLEPEKFDSVIFGGDSKQHMVVVISGAGVGKQENLQCVADKAKEKSGKDQMTFEEKDGKTTLNLGNGEGTGYLVNDNMLVVAEKSWAGAVAELIDGKGKPAVDNSLKDVFARAKSSSHLWVAGVVPAEMGSNLGPAEGAKDMEGSLDFSSGLKVAASAGYADAEAAKGTGDKLQAEFDKVKGMAGMVGVPQTVVDTVKIEVADTSVNISASATDEDLTAINETLQQMFK